MRCAPMLAIVSSMALALGCGKDEDEKTKSTSDLEGTWTAACGTDDTGESKSYDTTTKKYAGGTVSADIQTYTDANCTTEDMRIRAVGTYTTGAAVATPAGATAYDITPTQMFLTLSDAETIKTFNGETEGVEKVCGGGFVAGQEKELTKAACAGSPFEDFFKTVYGVYKVDGGKLYEGEVGDDGTATDGSTADKRPTTLRPRGLTKG